MGYIKLVRRSAEQKPLVKPLVKEEVSAARIYPDGTTIPAALPVSYAASVPGDPHKHCSICRHYSVANSVCVAFNSVVRPDYVCAAWAAVA